MDLSTFKAHVQEKHGHSTKREKKEKSSARSRGGTSCPPPPDGRTSNAHGGALSFDFSQITNMVIAVEKGNILHISHIENICQPKDKYP